MSKSTNTFLLPGDPDIVVRLRRAPHARRMTLRVSRLDGRVTVSAPPRLPRQAVQSFLSERAGWVRGQLAQCAAEIRPDIGATIPVEGQPHRIGADDDQSMPRITEGRISVARDRPCVPQVAALLKALARERIASACDRNCVGLGVSYARLTLRDTRSRWGSCTSAGNLMFSWRLIMAEPGVLNYVAAHEVAHLREMNHSRAFWALVEELCPDYSGYRRWLRQHGPDLHRVRFDA